MIITKLLMEKKYESRFLPPKNSTGTKVFSGILDEKRMKEENYPEHIIESFKKSSRYGSVEYTVIDWEINEYLKTIHGHELIDIKFSTDKGSYTRTVLVITEKKMKEEVK